MLITTGSIRAATPILFMKADKNPETDIITIINPVSLLPENLRTLFPIITAMLVLTSEALKIYIAHIVTTAGLPNAATASCGVTKPVIARKQRTISAVISTRNLPVINTSSANTKISATRRISFVMLLRCVQNSTIFFSTLYYNLLKIEETY